MTTIKKTEEIKMVKFYLNKENFTEDYRKTAINHTAYYAVKKRRESGNKLIDFDDAIFDNDVPEIVDTLKRMGETEFTISSGFSRLVNTLSNFAKFGANIKGLTEVNSVYTNCITGKREKVPAILMKLD